MRRCKHAFSLAAKRFSLRSTQTRRTAPGVRSIRPNHGPSPLQAVFSFRSTRDRRIAPGVRSLRPNHGPSPLQAVFSLVNSRPTHRSRRALTSAESWPFPASSGFLFGQLETDASLQACAHFGRIMALPRFKRFSFRSTTISDRLGVRAPKAIRAKAVTYRAKGHFGD
jgi:hypothetical protein